MNASGAAPSGAAPLRFRNAGEERLRYYFFAFAAFAAAAGSSRRIGVEPS